jgi:Trk K+ transport system NAD-binding subunit
MAQAGLTNRTLNATLILMVALLFSYMAELAGLHAILGAFIAGLFLREGMLERRLFADINKLVHDMSIGFLAPIFFVTAGFEVTFDVFQTDLWFLITVVAVATLGKIVGTALFYLPSGNGWREAVTVGVGMNDRGAVEIIIAGIGLQMGIIDNTIFSILVFMAIFTTATVPLLLTWSVNWLRDRDELVTAGEARDGVLLVGAGPTARLLASAISDRHPVWLIDSNRDHCQTARDEGFNSVCGDAKSQKGLAEAHAERAQALLTMTPNAETNVIAAQIAFLVYDVPEIYVMVDERLTRGMGTILTDINAKDVCSAYPVDIEEWDYRVLHGQAEVVEKPITESMRLSSLVSNAGSRELLPLLVHHEGEITFPCSSLQLEPGDSVLALERVTAEVAE